LNERYTDLWKAKHDEIEQQLLTGSDGSGKSLQDLETDVEKAKRKKLHLAQKLDKLKVESQTQNNETLAYTLEERELQNLQGNQQVLRDKLDQLEFESNQEHYRISRVYKAAVPPLDNGKLLKYMAIVPVGILFMTLMLFLMLEFKAQRVADLDSLSTCVQSEVYALPPLPLPARSSRRQSVAQADDQIEQFIQRLDHLRFAVCGNPAEINQGRCVLITSAIGGEGKTTLAAHLAARCGNAGISTLLIDADLRRSRLCALLDVPEGPGLSDALVNDEVSARELVLPVQGGAFYFLTAGTPVQDTSRVLQNRKLGLLIAEFRQLYDLVIIDSPPVLPVPDALIVGRWVDGAVLAVRYDISRFPQVERARRQLDGSDVPVLGTVINGMRNSDSYYGRYVYSRRRSPQADSSNTI
jgi:capsular exopolysaccharide synthesis family protein